MHSRFFAFAYAIALAALAACSSPAASPHDDAAPPDPDAAPDASPPPPSPAPPQVVDNGGPTVASPTVVPVFFGSDTLQGSLETFLQALSTSAYWTATTKEYGIGALEQALEPERAQLRHGGMHAVRCRARLDSLSRPGGGQQLGLRDLGVAARDRTNDRAQR